MIPIGDPLADVEKYICEKFPGSCHSVPGATVQVTVKRGSTDKLTDEMIAWLDRALINHSQDKLVLKAKALERGEICRKCPMNVSWNRSCGVCSEAVGRLSSMVRAGQDVAFGKRLFACRVFKHENRSAVWLREQPPQEASGSAPAFCWAK
ncbi:MAG: hypothetical protein M0Q93_00200 [Terrimicrobiaceae bacterium]|nr:hypothetical protein [Terrimicrobiaceae bacterium]